MTTPAIRRITRNSAYIVGTRIINLLVRMAWVVIAARILGPDLYALLAYTMTWQSAFLPLALFGVGPALSYLVGPDRSRAPDYAGHVLAIRLLTIIVAVAACVLLSRVVTPDPRAPELIAVLSLILAARALGNYTQTLYNAFEINQYAMRQEFLFSLLDLAISLAILLNGGSLLLLVSAKAVVAWLKTGWALFIAHRVAIPIRLDWQPARWRPILRVALPAMISTLAIDWCFNGSLVLFRSLTDDGILFGQYALAMQALSITAVLPLALSRAAFPALRRAVARGDGKELLFASAMQRASPVFGTAAGLLGLALGEPLFRWVLGEPFSTAGELLGLTLWCLIPLTATAGYFETLIVHGRFRAVVIITVSGATVMTVMTFLLAPLYGVTGVIVAAFLGFSVPPAGAYILSSQLMMTDPLGDVVRPFAAAALSVGAYLALASFSDWVALVAGLLTLVAGSLALRVIGPADIRAMRSGFSSG